MRDGLVLMALLVCNVVACTTAAFKYKYYGVAPEPGHTSMSGVLLGPEPKDDLPLSTCDPDDRIKGKCVLMMTDEFERLRADLIDCRHRVPRDN